MASLRILARVFSCAAFAVASAGAFAQGFAALVSPPRFELAGKPGEKIRDVVEITNAGAQPAKYKLRTADWTFAKDASVTFDDSLRPGSCRPWVAIESRQITVSQGGKYRYRFEVAPPADAPAGECRFALLIEGDDQQVQTPGGPAFPIAGRLAVIVYVTVGAAEANLAIREAEDEDGRLPGDARGLPVEIFVGDEVADDDDPLAGKSRDERAEPLHREHGMSNLASAHSTAPNRSSATWSGPSVHSCRRYSHSPRP